MLFVFHFSLVLCVRSHTKIIITIAYFDRNSAELDDLCDVSGATSGVARGEFGGFNPPPPIRIEAVFLTAVKSLLLNIITSL